MDYAQYGTAGRGYAGQVETVRPRWCHQSSVRWKSCDPEPELHLKILGQAPATPLVAPTDKAVLDDTLITLFAAAEILAAQKAEAASLKLQKANQFLRRHFANLGGGKRKTAVLGGYGSMPGQGRSLTPGLDYVPPGYNG